MYVVLDNLKGNLWILPRQQVEQKEWEFESGRGILQFVSITFTTFSEEWPNLSCHKSYNEQEWERIGTCKAMTDGAGIRTFEEDNGGCNC